MKCSKCGHENKPGSEFCSRCGAKLQPKPAKKPRKSKGNKVIVWLVVIIIILVIAIGLILGMKSSKPSNNTTSTSSTTIVSKKKVIKQSSKVVQQTASSSSSQEDTSANLKVSDLKTPELMSAAVALYGGKNISNSLWTTFKDPSFVGSEISITTAQEQNVSQEGNGNFYNLSIDSHDTGMGYGGGIGYVLSDDGNTVYFYQIGVSPDSKISPKLEVSVGDIVNWINQNHMADTVRNLANRLYIK